MDTEIESQFKRAEELLEELEKEYKTSLHKKIISTRAKNLTHEVLSKLRGTLDHSMRIFFEKNISPTLLPQEEKKARVYFPIVNSDQALASILGRAKMSDLQKSDSKIYNYIKAIQPYINSSYKWLEYLNAYAAEGKHVRLSPQKRIDTKRITISSGRASISLGQDASITLGSGAKIFLGGREIRGNQTINVDSDGIYGDPDLEVKKEVWVSFLFTDSNINPLNLCKESLPKTKKVVEDFLNLV